MKLNLPPLLSRLRCGSFSLRCWFLFSLFSGALCLSFSRCSPPDIHLSYEPFHVLFRVLPVVFLPSFSCRSSFAFRFPDWLATVTSPPSFLHIYIQILSPRSWIKMISSRWHDFSDNYCCFASRLITIANWNTANEDQMCFQLPPIGNQNDSRQIRVLARLHIHTSPRGAFVLSLSLQWTTDYTNGIF